MILDKEYVKLVLTKIAGSGFISTGPSIRVDFKRGGRVRVFGTIGSCVAVGVESRGSKQVRGAVVDLICHPYRKKLLILVSRYLRNPTTLARQCESIMTRFLDQRDFKVVLLHGKAGNPEVADDMQQVMNALKQLGCATTLSFHSL